MRLHWDPKAVFEGVESHLPSALVPDARRDKCRRVAASLPSATLSYYLECRLDADEQVDFLVLTRHRGAGRLFREALGDAHTLGAWQRTLALFDAWGTSRDTTLGRVPFFWLEYDLDERFQESAPLASPGLCLEPDYLSRFKGQVVVNRERAWELSEEGLRRLLNDGERARLAPILRRCVQSLPESAAPIHVSAMLARDPLRLKLYAALPKAQLTSYLRQIGWSGQYDAVEQLLTTSYAPIDRTVFIDLAIGETLEPSLGVAFSQFHQAEMAGFAPTWDWVPMPGADDAKRHAAFSWPGLTETTVDGQRCWIHRWLDIKAVVGATGVWRHKAYLGYMATEPPAFS
jgi:hypothetical protein